MRTTLTLDDDLARRLEALRAERRLSLKDVVNQAIRQGLMAFDSPPGATDSAGVTQPMTLGRRLIGDMDDIGDALAVAEGEDFR